MACYEKWAIYLKQKIMKTGSLNNLLVHSKKQEVNDNRQHIYFLLKSSSGA